MDWARTGTKVTLVVFPTTSNGSKPFVPPDSGHALRFQRTPHCPPFVATLSPKKPKVALLHVSCSSDSTADKKSRSRRVAGSRPSALGQECILAVDVGTGGSKAALVSRLGEVLSVGFSPHTAPAPAVWPGSGLPISKSAQQDPQEWWRATQEAIRCCLQQREEREARERAAAALGGGGGEREEDNGGGGEGEDHEKGRKGQETQGSEGEDRWQHRIRALAITGQMQDVILLPKDPSAAPPPAILYCDSRAEQEAEEICAAAGGQSRLAAATGMPQGATSLLAKLLWLDRHESQSRSSSWRVVFGGHDFVAGLLCGSFVTDSTTATTTGLTSSTQGAGVTYAVDLLGELNLSHWMPLLPPIHPVDTPCGHLSQQSAEAIGCRQLAGIPVFHACGDLGACSIGSGAGATGSDYVYLGTSGWIAASCPRGLRDIDPDAPAPSGVFRLAHPDPSLEFRTASVMTAGGNLQWAVASLMTAGDAGADPSNLDALFRRANQEAASVPAGSRGLIYLPYLQGERCPFEDGDARAAFLGISAATGRAEMMRAVMEGVAFSLQSAAAAMHAGVAAPREKPLRIVGGGARSTLWPEVFAGVFNRPVEVLAESQEIGVKGAAWIAAKGLGWCHGYGSNWLNIESCIERPSQDIVNVYEEAFMAYEESSSVLRRLHRRLGKAKVAMQALHGLK